MTRLELRKIEKKKPFRCWNKITHSIWGQICNTLSSSQLYEGWKDIGTSHRVLYITIPLLSALKLPTVFSMLVFYFLFIIIFHKRISYLYVSFYMFSMFFKSKIQGAFIILFQLKKNICIIFSFIYLMRFTYISAY